MKNNVDTGYSWIILMCCFVIYMLSAGCLKTFGILYGELQETFNSGSGNTVSVGSTTGFIQSITSPLANSLGTSLSFRKVAFIGGLLLSLAFLLSGFVPSLQWLFFTYSAIGGIGCGFTIATSLTIVNFFFEKRRNLAAGIVVSAGGVGSFFLPPLYRYLFDRYALRGALLILSGLFLHICIAALLIRQPNILTAKEKENFQDRTSTFESSSKNKILSSFLALILSLRQVLTNAFDFDWTLMKNVSYVLYVMSLSFNFLGYTANYYMLPPLIESLGYGKQNVVFTMSLFGLSDLIARVFSGWFLDFKLIPVKSLFIFNVVIGGIAAEILPFIQKYEYICVYAVVIGVFPGTFYTLIPSLLVDEIGLKRLPKAYGLVFMFAAVVYFVGNPGLGWLEDTTGNWNLSFHVVGIVFILSAIIMLAQIIYSRHRSHDQKLTMDHKNKDGDDTDTNEREAML